MIDRMAPIESQNKAKAYQRKVFKHQQAVNEMLKVIGACPMDDELKMIMRMKIWGTNPKVFLPLTHEEIAVLLKCKVKDVKRWEEDAVYNVKAFLTNTGLKAAQEKFDKDNLIENIVNPQKRIIV